MLWAATPTCTPGRSAAQARSASVRARKVSTSGSQNRRWPGSGSRRSRPVIGRGKQHDLEAALDGRLGQRDRHRVGLAVRSAVGLVDDVVKLADGAVAGSRHLRVDAPADVAHRLGVVLSGEPVHLGAPAPEVIARMRALADPAQVELERMAVRVGHARNRNQPASHGRVGAAIWTLPSKRSRASSRTYTGSPATNAASTGLRPSRYGI